MSLLKHHNKACFIVICITLVTMIAGLNVFAASASDSDALLRKYEAGDSEFGRYEIGNKIVYFHQRMIGDAIVEGDFSRYHFDIDTEEILDKTSHWRDDLPETLPEVISKEAAEAMVNGTVQFSRLYFISPESDIHPIKPTPSNPCWIVRSIADGKMIITIVDAVSGEILGPGVAPPYGGFSMSGPEVQDPCGDPWTTHYTNAADWFETMGYPTERVEFPTEEQISSHIQSTDTAMFYELAHGGYWYFSRACASGSSYADFYPSQVEDWMQCYNPMRFAFIGSCDGMCETGDGTFSYEFRKGLTEDTVTVGYCGMSTEACESAWSNSVNWQDAMFSYMNAGQTVWDAFINALADYPICIDCMRFEGDQNYAVVPVVERGEFNQPPVADADGPYAGGVGDTINFDGSGSYDTNCYIALYEWDFETDGVYDYSSFDPSAAYDYSDDFVGMATLRVTNGAGLTDTDTASVEVRTPPAAVTDLEVGNPTCDTLELTWTAPGDDENVGTASEYDVRYSITEPTPGQEDTWWAAATQCTGEPSPQVSGSSESFVVTGLSSFTHYYFALKTADEIPNWSEISNIPTGRTDILFDMDGVWGLPNGDIFPGGATCDRWATGPGDTPTAVDEDDLSVQNTVLGDENQVRYGWEKYMPCEDTAFGNQSGFGFDGTEDLCIDFFEPFPLGEFTHYNNCIVKGSFELLSVPLNLNIDFGDGNPIELTVKVLLNESDNQGQCPDCCDDMVSFESVISDCFTIPGDITDNEYRLRILGFTSGTNCAGDLTYDFATSEGMDNKACLMGVIEGCGDPYEYDGGLVQRQQSLMGDANSDSTVNFSDLIILAVSYTTSVGDPDFDSRADFDGSGTVDFSDLTLLASNYGKSSFGGTATRGATIASEEYNRVQSEDTIEDEETF